MHLASAAVRHTLHGTTRGIRKARRLEEVSVPARKVLSSEFRALQKSNPKVVRPILANKRRAVLWLLASLARC